MFPSRGVPKIKIRDNVIAKNICVFDGQHKICPLLSDSPGLGQAPGTHSRVITDDTK